MSFEKSSKLTTQKSQTNNYCWDYVKEYAEVIFDEPCMHNWVRASWDILLKHKALGYNSRINDRLDKTVMGDIVLWLTALYDVTSDFQKLIKTEKGLKTKHIVDNYDKNTYMDIWKKNNDFEENVDTYITGCETKKSEKSYFTGCIKIPNIKFNKTYYPQRTRETIINEIKYRRNRFQKCLYETYKYSPIKILYFMAGHNMNDVIYNENTNKTTNDKFISIEELNKKINGSQYNDMRTMLPVYMWIKFEMRSI